MRLKVCSVPTNKKKLYSIQSIFNLLDLTSYNPGSRWGRYYPHFIKRKQLHMETIAVTYRVTWLESVRIRTQPWIFCTNLIMPSLTTEPNWKGPINTCSVSNIETLLYFLLVSDPNEARRSKKSSKAVSQIKNSQL